MQFLHVVSMVAAALLAVSSCKKLSETDDGSGGTGGNGPGSERCEPLCAEFAASGCANGTNHDNCLITCLSLTSSSSCASSAEGYFDCTDGTSVQCSAANDPYFPGCGDEWLVAIGCAVTANPNPAVEQPCDAYCDNIVAADCENNNPKSECYTNCLWWGATGTGCDDEWRDYLDCANGVTMECLAGYAVAPGCGPDFSAYWSCVDAVGN